MNTANPSRLLARITLAAALALSALSATAAPVELAGVKLEDKVTVATVTLSLSLIHI